MNTASITLQHKNVKHVVTVESGNNPFKSLCNMFRIIFQLSAPPNQLYYIDGDGDCITICSDQDFLVAIADGLKKVFYAEKPLENDCVSVCTADGIGSFVDDEMWDRNSSVTSMNSQRPPDWFHVYMERVLPSVVTQAIKDAGLINEEDHVNHSERDLNVHNNTHCTFCSMTPIRGIRFKCTQCPTDLCEKCETKIGEKHNPRHVWLKIRVSEDLHPVSHLPRDVMTRCGRKFTKHNNLGKSFFKVRFLDDISYPDGTNVEKNFEFTKKWLIANTGPTQWPSGCYIKNESSVGLELKNGDIIDLPPLAPGGQHTVETRLKTSSRGGIAKAVWGIYNVDKVKSDNYLWCNVVVNDTCKDEFDNKSCVGSQIQPDIAEKSTHTTKSLERKQRLIEDENWTEFTDIPLPDCFDLEKPLELDSDVSFANCRDDFSDVSSFSSNDQSLCSIGRNESLAPHTVQAAEAVAPHPVRTTSNDHAPYACSGENLAPHSITSPNISQPHSISNTNSVPPAVTNVVNALCSALTNVARTPRTNPKEEDMIKTLLSMGFTNREENRRVLRKNDMDLVSAITDLCTDFQTVN